MVKLNLKGDTKQIVNVFGLMAVLVFIGAIITQSIGFSRGGFESQDILTQFMFYIGPAAFTAIGILIIFGIALAIKQGDAKYGNSIVFNSPGEGPSPSFLKKMGSFQLVLLSFIVFGVLALVTFSRAQQAFTGVGVLEQQFTVIDSILFSSALVPIAENLPFAFLLAFIMFGTRYFARRFNLSKGVFIALVYIIGILAGGAYGYFQHILRYDSSEFDLTVVFVFWSLGALITLVSGSFIPFWIMHLMNNLVFDLSRLGFSNELVLGSFVGGVIAMGLFYFALYGLGFGKKDKT